MAFLKEIWCEGNPRLDQTACNLGYGNGATLAEACEDYATRNPYFDKHFSRRFMTYKGDKLHDNEFDARERYG